MISAAPAGVLDLIADFTGVAQSETAFRANYASQLAVNEKYVDRCAAGAAMPEYDGDPELAAFFAPAVASGRSIAFVTAHWGNYVRSFSLLGNCFPPGSSFMAIRGRAWNEREDALWSAINTGCKSDIRIHRLFDRKSLIQVVRHLQAGGHLFAMFDLFDEYGEVTPVDIYGQWLHFTFGWSELAFLADTLVVIIASHNVQSERLRILDVLDPRGFADKAAFSKGCRDACARGLETMLAEAPASWLMWDHMGKYLAGSAR